MAKAKSKDKAKKSKDIRPMFWIGGNYYDSRKVWNKIRSSVGDPNIVNFHCGLSSDASAASAADVILALKHRDMFDDRPRIIRMQNIPEDYASIADYLYLVNDNNILVVDSPVGYRKKRRLISAASSNFYKTIKKEGKAFISDEEARDNRTAITWLKGVVKDLKGSIDAEAASFLVKEVSGRNYDLLYANACTLVDYSEKIISVEDVKQCCVTAYQRVVWDLIDNLDYGKFDDVILHLQAFYEHAGTEVGSTFDGELERLYGALVSHFTALLLIKGACGDNISYQKASDALKPFKKKSKVTGKWDLELYNSRHIGALVNKPAFQSALRWDKRRIYMVNCDLLRSRAYNRMSSSKAESRTSLDVFAMFVCGKISFDDAAMLRGITDE